VGEEGKTEVETKDQEGEEVLAAKVEDEVNEAISGLKSE
jgi:hypothetical protein